MPNEYTIHNGNGNENEEEESIMFGHLQTLRFSKACVSRKVVATGYWLAFGQYYTIERQQQWELMDVLVRGNRSLNGEHAKYLDKRGKSRPSVEDIWSYEYSSCLRYVMVIHLLTSQFGSCVLQARMLESLWKSGLETSIGAR